MSPQGLAFFLLFGLLPLCFSDQSAHKIHKGVLHKESGPAIMFPMSDGNGCDDSGECLKKLQTFLHLHSLPFASNEAEMDELCNATVGGYNCSSQLQNAPNCLTDVEKDFFKAFIVMAQVTFTMFCPYAPGEQGYLRQAMLENGKCLSKHRSSIDCCMKRSKVPDLPTMQIMDQSGKSATEKELEVCCPMANFIKCVEPVTTDFCGPSAANFTTQYIQRSAGEQVQGACQHLRSFPNPDPAYCSDPVPKCSGCTAVRMSMVALMCLLLVLYH